MNKVIAWWKSSTAKYQWYRQEYKRIHNLLFNLVILTIILGEVLSIIFQIPGILEHVWTFLPYVICACLAIAECAVAMTLRYVDEHESRLSKGGDNSVTPCSQLGETDESLNTNIKKE